MTTVHAQRSVKHASRSVAGERPKNRGNSAAGQFNDSRTGTMQQKMQALADNSPQAKQTAQLKAIANNAAQPIQRMTYGPSMTRKVKVEGDNSKSVEFEECLSNSVEYKAGEKLSSGSGTGTAGWAGWLKDEGTGHNATQLHVVNERWGGLGEADKGNLLPGSQSLNMKHKKGEKLFDACFDSSGAATKDCKYECSAAPGYSNSSSITVSKSLGTEVTATDPDMEVTVTYGGVKGSPVKIDKGKGVRFKDGS